MTVGGRQPFHWFGSCELTPDVLNYCWCQIWEDPYRAAARVDVQNASISHSYRIYNYWQHHHNNQVTCTIIIFRRPRLYNSQEIGTESPISLPGYHVLAQLIIIYYTKQIKNIKPKGPKPPSPPKKYATDLVSVSFFLTKQWLTSQRGPWRKLGRDVWKFWVAHSASRWSPKNAERESCGNPGVLPVWRHAHFLFTSSLKYGAAWRDVCKGGATQHASMHVAETPLSNPHPA